MTVNEVIYYLFLALVFLAVFFSVVLACVRGAK